MLVNKLTIWLLVAALLQMAGCGSEKPIPKNPPPPTALSWEEWQKLEVSEKYDGATLERLRMQDPKLQSDLEWDRYMRTTVMPERRKDIPLPAAPQK